MNEFIVKTCWSAGSKNGTEKRLSYLKRYAKAKKNTTTSSIMMAFSELLYDLTLIHLGESLNTVEGWMRSNCKYNQMLNGTVELITTTILRDIFQLFIHSYWFLKWNFAVFFLFAENRHIKWTESKPPSQ